MATVTTGLAAACHCRLNIDPAAVGKLTSHAGQQKILLTITLEAAAQIKRLVANVHTGLNHVATIEPQLTKPQRWFAWCTTSSSKFWPASLPRLRFSRLQLLVN